MYKNLLEHSKKYKQIVCGELCNSDNDDCQGFISEIYNDQVVIYGLDDYGQNNGVI